MASTTDSTTNRTGTKRKISDVANQSLSQKIVIPTENSQIIDNHWSAASSSNTSIGGTKGNDISTTTISSSSSSLPTQTKRKIVSSSPTTTTCLSPKTTHITNNKNNTSTAVTNTAKKSKMSQSTANDTRTSAPKQHCKSKPSYFVALVPDNEMKHNMSFAGGESSKQEIEEDGSSMIADAASVPQEQLQHSSENDNSDKDCKTTSWNELEKSMIASPPSSLTTTTTTSVAANSEGNHPKDANNDNDDDDDYLPSDDDDYLPSDDDEVHHSDDDDEIMDDGMDNGEDMDDDDPFDDDDFHSQDDEDYDEEDDLDSYFDDHDDDYDEDSDEDEYDSDECSCSHCTEERIHNRFMMAHMMAPSFTGRMGGIFGDDDDDDSDSNDDSDKEANNNGKDTDHDGKDQTPYDGPQCAVCFNDPKTNNPFVVLPCCGSDGQEEKSSTRFCKKCIMKCLLSQNSPTVMGRTSPEILINNIIARDGAIVGECPRCRDLISYNSSKEEAERAQRHGFNLTNVVYHRKKYNISTASFLQAVEHAEAHEQLGETMRSLLFITANVNPDFIPLELLGGESESARKLVLWNVLDNKIDDIYCIDRTKQNTLRCHIEQNMAAFAMDDAIDDKTYGLLLSGKMLQAAYEAICNKHILTSFRLLNHAITKFLSYLLGFPELRYAYQEYLVVGMNVFLLIMATQVLIIGFLYAAVCVAVVNIMGKFIKFVDKQTKLIPPKREKMIMRLAMLSIVGILTWILKWYFYHYQAKETTSIVLEGQCREEESFMLDDQYPTFTSAK